MELEAIVLRDSDWQPQERMKLISQKRNRSNFAIPHDFDPVTLDSLLVSSQCILRTCTRVTLQQPEVLEHVVRTKRKT